MSQLTLPCINKVQAQYEEKQKEESIELINKNLYNLFKKLNYNEFIEIKNHLIHIIEGYNFLNENDLNGQLKSVFTEYKTFKKSTVELKVNNKNDDQKISIQKTLYQKKMTK